MEENKEENKEEKIEGNNVENDIIELKKTIETQKIQLEELDDRFKRVAAEETTLVETEELNLDIPDANLEKETILEMMKEE